MEKIKITTLEKNPSLARGSVPNNFKEQWETIATVINSLGPPIRTGDGWQKIWRDLKLKVKRKIATNKAESKATGGGIFNQVMLSPLEEAVANLLQFQKQINSEGMVQGVPNSEESSDVYFLESFELEREPIISSKVADPSTISAPTAPSTSTTPPTSSVPSTTTTTPNPSKRNSSSALKRNENPAKRNELIERHSADQARILTDISNSISSLKRSLRDIKDIQAKQLKLEVERSKREAERSKREEKRPIWKSKGLS